MVLQLVEERVDVGFVVESVPVASDSCNAIWDSYTHALIAACCRTSYAALVNVQPLGGFGSRGGSLGSKYGAIPAKYCSELKLYVS